MFVLILLIASVVVLGLATIGVTAGRGKVFAPSTVRQLVQRAASTPRV